MFQEKFLFVFCGLFMAGSLWIPAGSFADGFGSDSSAVWMSLPISLPREAVESRTITATAYSSEVWQTDDTPWVTASGSRTRPGVLAANFLPIGTRVKMPALYGDRVFIVEDRMHPRFSRRIDVWMPETSQALAFGIQQVKIEVYR